MTTPRPEPEVIQTRDVPQLLLDEMREKLWTYTASAFGVEGDRPLYGGTVTCVTAVNQPYLLTAAHVWRVLRRGERFALSLESDRLLVPIRRDSVDVSVLAGDDGPPELGPDLALIRLPASVAFDIGNVKAFYNLDRRLAEAVATPVDHEAGLWAIIGAPAEQSTFGAREAILRITLFGSGVDNAVERDGFDYLDLSFNHEGRADLPRSYGGLSGSGLWQIAITMSAATGEVSWPGQASLEGVAFYQSPSVDDRGFIRCHGRKSIYVRAMSARR
jgi:hypothetical protein